MMTKEVTDTRTAQLWVEEDNIVNVLIKQNAEINIDDIKEIKEAKNKLIIDSDHTICIDIRSIKSITKKARDFTGNKETFNKSMRAMALILDSPISRVIGNLFMGLNKPLYPTKLFNDKEKAFKWLQGFFA